MTTKLCMKILAADRRATQVTSDEVNVVNRQYVTYIYTHQYQTKTFTQSILFVVHVLKIGLPFLFQIIIQELVLTRLDAEISC